MGTRMGEVRGRHENHLRQAAHFGRAARSARRCPVHSGNKRQIPGHIRVVAAALVIGAALPYEKLIEPLAGE